MRTGGNEALDARGRCIDSRNNSLGRARAVAGVPVTDGEEDQDSRRTLKAAAAAKLAAAVFQEDSMRANGLADA